ARRAAAEQVRRDAMEAERRRMKEAARADRAGADAKKRDGTKAERRKKKAARASLSGAKSDGDRRPDDSVVAAMAENRSTVMARIPDPAPTTTKGDEVGPLGPGIRPADFWGT
ncbi:MAG: hypothetical protein ACRDY1_13600, partial [Acidimicrobiales bacterium]